jgi:hypothetical protein
MGHKANTVWICALLGCLLTACAADPGWTTANLSDTEFKDEVYPVLIRDCAFQACHGAEGRFFRVWGPGRARLNPARSSAFDEATMDEINQSYQRAVGMIDRKDPTRSLLLRKALAQGAGGAGHLGADKFGRNVYRTVDDQGYLVLSRWAFSEKKMP